MTTPQKERPGICVATVVVRDGKILLGKDVRKNATGVQGGHWESGETLKECALREVREESGVVARNPGLISVHDFYRPDKQRSYVSIGMKAEYVSGELIDLKEEGRLEWRWHTPEEALALENLYQPDRVLIIRFLSGKI